MNVIYISSSFTLRENPRHNRSSRLAYRLLQVHYAKYLTQGHTSNLESLNSTPSQQQQQHSYPSSAFSSTVSPSESPPAMLLVSVLQRRHQARALEEAVEVHQEHPIQALVEGEAGLQSSG
jgi:hypothetical protein